MNVHQIMVVQVVNEARKSHSFNELLIVVLTILLRIEYSKGSTFTKTSFSFMSGMLHVSMLLAKILLFFLLSVVCIIITRLVADLGLFLQFRLALSSRREWLLPMFIQRS